MASTYDEKTLRRAVHIAAAIMHADGLCRYDSARKRRRLYAGGDICGKCIEKWLLNKARKELQKPKC